MTPRRSASATPAAPTTGQDFQSQLDALTAAGCGRIFSEKISTQVKVRPKLKAALIGLDRIVGVPLDVMPRGRQQLVEHARVDR